jgi:farnesyl-diphosphate farnesyltransferase
MNRHYLLNVLLKNVSRSFYLTLRILPARLGEPIGLAYLLARTADTIADTELVAPARRLALLAWLRARINGAQATATPLDDDAVQAQANARDRALLASFEQMLALLRTQDAGDREAVRHVNNVLISGMDLDLRTFPTEGSGQIVALSTLDELDRYTFLVAGCVGQFWTEITRRHTPALHRWDLVHMSELGIRFGKALQMVNILRDCATDLRNGRCYLPSRRLALLGLHSQDLLLPGAAERVRPLFAELMARALDHFRAAQGYTLAIPRRCVRLRLACLWPMLIGLETLSLLVREPAWPSPAAASKVTRRGIYRIVVLSSLLVGSNTAIRLRVAHLMRDIEGRMARRQ